MRNDATMLACMRKDAMRLACMRNDATMLACMRKDAMRLACMRNDATMLACMRKDAMRLACMRNEATISNLCISGLEYRYQHGGIGTNSSLEFVYRCSPIGTGTVSLRIGTFIWVSVPFDKGIGTLFRVSVPFDSGIGTPLRVPILEA
ncbi:hypothetical protein V6N12_034567 [Hibiscus sabdariffa]|uniref:Uncharacterized protein n=1 Tax=Hibiscus sabdariffa TaxID=183260 RepID=A0ABR2DHJ8_9ROSI